MELAATIASPPRLTYVPRLLSATSSADAAASDVDGPGALEKTRPEASTSGNTSSQARTEHGQAAADRERDLLRRLTADDFAAIQEQLGLVRKERNEDAGIPGDVTPVELTEVSLVDVEAGLTISETAERTDTKHVEPENLKIPEDTSGLPLPDFSAVVADAIVTIDEYLDWVNEAGGQAR